MRSTPAALLALAGGAVAYTTRPSSAARISAFAAFADPKMQKEQAKGSVADCSKCGRARGGALNCCSAGGAWAGTCTDALSDGGEHTWAEGFVACKAAAQEEALSHSEYVAAAPVGGMDDMAPVGGMDDMADLPELTPSQHETLKSTQAAMGRADSAALENCKDDDPEQCPAWAQLGECDSNAAYMHSSCRLSCGACSKTLSARRKLKLKPSPSPAPAASPSPAASPAPSKALKKAEAKADKAERAAEKLESKAEKAEAEATRVAEEAAEKLESQAAKAEKKAEKAEVKEQAAEEKAEQAEEKAEKAQDKWDQAERAQEKAQEKAQEAQAQEGRQEQAQEEEEIKAEERAEAIVKSNAEVKAAVKAGEQEPETAQESAKRVAAERQKVVREQLAREAEQQAAKKAAEAKMSKEEKDAADRAEYEAAIAKAMEGAKTAARDPNDRMEVWEAAINKKTKEGKTDGVGNKLEAGQLRAPTKQELATAAIHQDMSGGGTDSPLSADGVKAQQLSQTQSKGAFSAFASASAEAREVCKGKQGECSGA